MTDSNSAPRLHEIDRLRVGAVLLVFVVHVMQVFSPLEVWHIDSPEKSRLLEQFTVFVGPWIMPLFMLLAGASAWFARRSRGDGEFVKLRVLRLLVPLAAGTLLLIPIQMYFFRVFRGEFEGSLLAFYPRFFDGLYPEGNFNWGHLWFLAYLFAYMLAALPIFRFLDTGRGLAARARLAAWMDRPGGLLLPACAIAIGQIVLRIPFTQTTGALVGDWATHGWLFLVFLAGYLLVAEPGLLETVNRRWRGMLVPAVASSAGIAWWSLPGDVFDRLPGTFGAEHVLFWTGFSLASWSWLVVLLGVARARRPAEGAFLRWAKPLVYPFYIFHQPVIVAVGFYLVEIPIGFWGRVLVVGVAAFLGTLAALEVARRIPGFRALFGLQPRLAQAPH